MSIPFGVALPLGKREDWKVEEFNRQLFALAKEIDGVQLDRLGAEGHKHIILDKFLQHFGETPRNLHTLFVTAEDTKQLQFYATSYPGTSSALCVRLHDRFVRFHEGIVHQQSQGEASDFSRKLYTPILIKEAGAFLADKTLQQVKAFFQCIRSLVDTTVLTPAKVETLKVRPIMNTPPDGTTPEQNELMERHYTATDRHLKETMVPALLNNREEHRDELARTVYQLCFPIKKPALVYDKVDQMQPLHFCTRSARVQQDEGLPAAGKSYIYTALATRVRDAVVTLGDNSDVDTLLGFTELDYLYYPADPEAVINYLFSRDWLVVKQFFTAILHAIEGAGEKEEEQKQPVTPAKLISVLLTAQPNLYSTKTLEDFYRTVTGAGAKLHTARRYPDPSDTAIVCVVGSTLFFLNPADERVWSTTDPNLSVNFRGATLEEIESGTRFCTFIDDNFNSFTAVRVWCLAILASLSVEGSEE